MNFKYSTICVRWFDIIECTVLNSFFYILVFQLSHNDSNLQLMTAGDQIVQVSLASIAVEAYATIIALIVSCYLFARFFKARRQLKQSSPQHGFLKSLTLAIMTMFTFIVFSITKSITHIEIMAWEYQILETVFHGHSNASTACHVIEHVSRLASSANVSLHLLIFCQSIFDNFSEANIFKHALKCVKLIQFVIIFCFIATNTMVMIFIDSKLVRLAHSQLHVCLAVINQILTISYSISGSIDTLISLLLLITFLYLSKQV